MPTTASTCAAAGGRCRDGSIRHWPKMPYGPAGAFTAPTPHLGRQGRFGRRPSRQSRCRLARAPARPGRHRDSGHVASRAGPVIHSVFGVKEALSSAACLTGFRVPDWDSRGLFETHPAARRAGDLGRLPPCAPVRMGGRVLRRVGADRDGSQGRVVRPRTTRAP